MTVISTYFQHFNKDFQNPQKRKQFDNMRLYQQQKELSKMSGFNKQFTLEYPKRLRDNSQQKNYATVSLCCLTVTNPFRDKIIRLVLNAWFDRIILLVIVVNCIFLAIDDPNKDALKYQVIADYIFLAIFTVEMVVKIIAMGFALRPHSYLRDPWNILDFSVVIVGWFGKTIKDTNVSAIRVIRILRPLRTVNSMPGMRKLVQSLLNSLPTLLDILILFLFFLIMFGTVATQLFQGLLRNRCKNMQTKEILFQDSGDIAFCQKDKDCPLSGDNGEVKCVDFGNPNMGLTSFDNIFVSVLNVIIIITLEGWTDMMYQIRDATGTLAYDFYFVMVVIFGTFFVLNLMIAVQSSYLNQSFDEERQKKKDEQQKKIENATPRSPHHADGQNTKNNKQVVQQQSSQKQVSNFEDAFNEAVNKNDQKIQQNDNQQDPEEVQEVGGVEKEKEEEKAIPKQRCIALRRLSEKVFTLIESKPFNIAVILLIFVNTIFLAIEYDHMPKKLSEVLNKANKGFTVVFAVEMLLKIFGLGIKAYVKDGFNDFDAIVVIVGLLDFANLGSKAITVMRAFRLLRIFKIVRSWTSLRKLLQTVIQSFASIANLALLMGLFMFIYALIGMQFFSGDKYDDDGNLLRMNFNSFGQGLITIFVLLTAENWNYTMAVYIKYHGFASSLYFVSWIVLGNIMLLNLFLAILLNFISDNLDDEDLQNESDKDEDDEVIERELDYITNQKVIKANNSRSDVSPSSQPIKEEDIRINVGSNQEPISEKSFEDDSSFHSKNKQPQPGSNKNQNEGQKRIQDIIKKDQFNQSEQLKIKEFQSTELSKSANLSIRKKKKATQIELAGRSLFLFKPDNKLRLLIKSLLEHPYFEGFIYHLIAINSLFLALDEPVLKDVYQKQTIKIMTQIISVIFITEAFLKIIALGFVIGKKTYLKDYWNILDFIIVIFSLANWIIESSPIDSAKYNVSFLRGFRALRALRPLRMVSKNEGMKTVVNSLLKSIPNLFNVLLISLLFLLVFGILGVQLFKGSSGHCTDNNINMRFDCLGMFYNNMTMQTEIREWVIPFTNFDNVMVSMITFFEISTFEDWPTPLYRTIDSVGEDKGPKINNRPVVALIFICFIFITNFFVMNLFVSVIVDKFNEEIKKKDGSHKFTDEQKEWVKMQRIMVTVNVRVIPVPPENKIRKICFRIVQSNKFEYFTVFIICLNTVVLCMDFFGSPQSYKNVINWANNAFVIIFTIEAALKLSGQGLRYYFHENWSRFDFLIVILSLVSMDQSIFSGFNVTALRIIRVARLLRMVKASKGLRHLLKTLYMSLNNILNTGMLLFLVFFTFSVAGMDLFGNIDYANNVSTQANFRTFYKSILTLFRAATGENWNGIMHDCFYQAGYISIFYWLVFQLIAHFIFLNVFIAVIYENFNDIKSSEDANEVLSLKRKDIKAFVNTWAFFNPNGDLFMKTTHFPAFLQELPPPLGYEGIKIEQSKLNKIIFCLNIRDHQGKVYFPEVMWAIFHSIIGNNDEKVHRCEQVVNIMKILKLKYKGLGKYVTPDSLCGNKFYRNEMTISKYLCALQIVNNWRKFRHLRNKPKEELLKKNDGVEEFNFLGGLQKDRMGMLSKIEESKDHQEDSARELPQKSTNRKKRSSNQNEESSLKSSSYNANQSFDSNNKKSHEEVKIAERDLQIPLVNQLSINKEQGKEDQMKIDDSEDSIIKTDSDMNESVLSEELNSKRQQNKLEQINQDVREFDFQNKKGEAGSKYSESIDDSYSNNANKRHII